MLLMFVRMYVAEVDGKSEWDAGTKWFEGGTNELEEGQVALRELSGREERQVLGKGLEGWQEPSG